MIFQGWSLVGVSRHVLGDCAALDHSWSLSLCPGHREASSLCSALPQRETPLYTSVNPAKLGRKLSSNKLSFSIVSLRCLMSAMKSSLAQGCYKSQYLTLVVSTVGLHTFSFSNNPGSKQPRLA